MARTESAMLALGTQAPEFSLPDVVSGSMIDLRSAEGPKGLLMMFICRHCPFVKHLEKALAKLGRLSRKGYRHGRHQQQRCSQLSSGCAAEPGRASAGACASFAYLYDETQDVARAYDAMCTPDFFLFDGDLKLIYRGQFDDSRPGNGVPVTGRDLRSAMDLLLAGEPMRPIQKPSLGCNIKWK